MPTCDEIKAVQLNWHSRSRQGCVYAAVMAKDTVGTEWQIECLNEAMSKSLVKRIDSIITEAMDNPDVQALSILLPAVLTYEDLTDFVHLAKSETGWNINDQTIYEEDSTIIKINVPMPNEVTDDGEPVRAWVLVFGDFDKLAKTRQSPYTELVMTVKSKQHFKAKHDKYSLYQYTKDSKDRDPEHNADNDAHLADAHIDGRTDNPESDLKIWNATVTTKRARLGLRPFEVYDDPRSKAKVSLVIKGYTS